jgi:thioredoxin reductase
MTNICDVAIIGAGPYGLSLAAHLAAANVDFRIFGRTLDSWRHHMPKDMLLKSEGFASSISAPDEAGTLKAYCVARGLAYADQGKPVPLDLFNEYASWFQTRYVPEVEETHVASIARNGAGFALELETGERPSAKYVVMAPGIAAFAHMHPALNGLPDWAASHSFAHRDAGHFKGRDVAVLGAGASAVDLAALLADSGAHVQIIARAGHVRFHAPPDAQGASLLSQIKNPPTGIGPGWRSFFCANTPLLFHRLPESLRLRVARRHLGPAPGWFMRARVEGRIPMQLGTQVTKAGVKGNHVELELVNGKGERGTATFDHVISATGYRPDLTRLPFLPLSLLSEITMVENTPVLSDQFESTAPGFYVTGPAAANAFGPLMRFMVGAEFASPRIAAHLRRRLGAAGRARAA